MTPRHVATTALMIALALTAPGAAVADAVIGPPSQCPPGSAPTFGHGGSYCAPRSCDDVACPAAGTCQDVGLCVATLHVEGGSSYEDFDDDIEVAIAPCESIADCVVSARDAYTATHTHITSEGEVRCERVRGCVATPTRAEPSERLSNERDPAPVPPGSSHRATGGCGGCSARATGSPALGALAMLALVRTLRPARR